MPQYEKAWLGYNGKCPLYITAVISHSLSFNIINSVLIILVMSYPMIPESPDFKIDADRGPYLVRVCSALIALTAIVVTLRFLSRRLSKFPLMWDDWLILIALVSWADIR